MLSQEVGSVSLKKRAQRLIDSIIGPKDTLRIVLIIGRRLSFAELLLQVTPQKVLQPVGNGDDAKKEIPVLFSI
jgi:hypothetical protein